MLRSLAAEINNDFYSAQNLQECLRLFHGRGHAYPGLEHVNVDWLDPVVLITVYKEESLESLQELARNLEQRIPDCRSVQVQYRCRKGAPVEVLSGEAITDTIVSEHGLKYHIQLGRAQNTGLFLDMRNGRDWVRRHAQGKRVLNLFAYTCAFSVAALDGGASFVVNFDNNKSVLKKGRENHQLNQLDPRSANFEHVDIFKSFGRLRKQGPYDLLICDPPSFQHGSVDIRRDYVRIIRKLPEFMLPQSQLMLCLNSPDLSEDFLIQMVADTCPAYHYLESIPTPEVFREAMPGKGLKVLIFESRQDAWDTPELQQ